MSVADFLISTPSDLDSGCSAPLDWMLAMLQQAMEEIMASEATPVQKANSIARLGNLYLKASQAADLKRENNALTARIAALEQQLTALEDAAGKLSHASARTTPSGAAPKGRLDRAMSARDGDVFTQPCRSGQSIREREVTPTAMPGGGREPALAGVGISPGRLEAD